MSLNPKKKISNPVKLDTLVKKLKTYQSELEMQKEQLKKLKSELEDAKNKYQDLYDFTPVGYLTINSKGLINEVNFSGAKMLGEKSPGLINKKFSGFIDKDYKNIFYYHCKQLFEKKTEQICEIKLVKKSGKKVFVSIKSIMIKDDCNGTDVFMSTLIDITQQRKNEEKLRYTSFHDQLTGLYNRAYFESELLRLDTERSLPLSIIIGDVNGLKLVNDSFGHEHGDLLLKNAARILKKVCRAEDIISRWGGDEFAIILPNTTDKNATEILNRIKKACSLSDSERIPANIALGSSTKERRSDNIESVIRKAENNMYKNKTNERRSFSNQMTISLKKILFEKTDESEEHIKKIKKLALALGTSLKLPKDSLQRLAVLAEFHDLGKISIPEVVIFKTGKCLKKELELIRKHSQAGYNICILLPSLSNIANDVLQHHENWDGSGYPNHNGRTNISVLSRIINIIDTYVSMTEKRAYRPPLPKEKALEEILKDSAKQFDPELVKRFVDMLKK